MLARPRRRAGAGGSGATARDNRGLDVALDQTFYTLLAPILPLLRALLPNQITTTEQVGKAMLEAVRRLPPQRLFENRDIRLLAGA